MARFECDPDTRAGVSGRERLTVSIIDTATCLIDAVVAKVRVGPAECRAECTLDAVFGHGLAGNAAVVYVDKWMLLQSLLQMEKQLPWFQFLSSRNSILGVRFVATMLLSQLCEMEFIWSVVAEKEKNHSRTAKARYTHLSPRFPGKCRAKRVRPA
jgi:hypothetical protein